MVRRQKYRNILKISWRLSPPQLPYSSYDKWDRRLGRCIPRASQRLCAELHLRRLKNERHSLRDMWPQRTWCYFILRYRLWTNAQTQDQKRSHQRLSAALFIEQIKFPNGKDLCTRCLHLRRRIWYNSYSNNHSPATNCGTQKRNAFQLITRVLPKTPPTHYTWNIKMFSSSLPRLRFLGPHTNLLLHSSIRHSVCRTWAGTISWHGTIFAIFTHPDSLPDILLLAWGLY